MLRTGECKTWVQTPPLSRAPYAAGRMIGAMARVVLWQQKAGRQVVGLQRSSSFSGRGSSEVLFQRVLLLPTFDERRDLGSRLKTGADGLQIKGLFGLQPGDEMRDLAAVRLDDLQCLRFGRMQQGDSSLIHARCRLVGETSRLGNLLSKERVIIDVPQIDGTDIGVSH